MTTTGMAPETFATVLEHIESGATLKASIRAAQTSWRALSVHLMNDPDAASRYARARIVSADFYADKVQDVVEQAVTPEDAALARVRVDAYKWRAAMANPQGYGDRVKVESTGELVIRVERVQPLTPPLLTASATLLPSPSTDADTPDA